MPYRGGPGTVDEQIADLYEKLRNLDSALRTAGVQLGTAVENAVSDHDDLSNVTSDQHHTQIHATQHQAGGTDSLTSYYARLGGANIFTAAGNQFNRDLTLGLGTTADSGLLTINAEDVASKALAIFRAGSVELARFRRHSTTQSLEMSVPAGKNFSILAGAANALPLILKGAADQTSDIGRWEAPAGTTASRINKDGFFMTRKTAAPADADLATSEVALWWDNSVGLTGLRVKGKDSAGTVITHFLGKSQTYAASNVATDRTYDADATTIDEIADVLGTLISDLRAANIIVV